MKPSMVEEIWLFKIAGAHYWLISRIVFQIFTGFSTLAIAQLSFRTKINDTYSKVNVLQAKALLVLEQEVALEQR